MLSFARNAVKIRKARLWIDRARRMTAFATGLRGSMKSFKT